MITFSNLKLWNENTREFELRDIEANYNPALFSINGDVIDCRDFLGVPLGIDLHVHFREPGYEHKEDFLSGAEAALFGGVLTVLDMPNTNPITDSVETLRQKRILSQKQDVVDILIAAAVTNTNFAQINALDAYCDAYKIFMSESFGNLKIDEANINSALSILEDIQTIKPIIFHAEDPNILAEQENESSHYKQRPADAEAVAIQKILQWAKDYSSLKMHVTHVSSSLSLKLLELADIPNLTSDTCPRYLYLNQFSELDEVLKKVNPPLRQETDNSMLIEALSMGVIDMISSDHSPHTLEEKKQSQPSGMPGVQELLLSLFSLVHSGELEWERAIEAYYTFPSKLLNIEKKQIEENFLIIDPYTPFMINSSWIKSKAGWSPFEKKYLYGLPRFVIKDSTVIVQNEI